MTETAMSTADRVAARERILQGCLAEARDLAKRRGRSMKCGGWPAPGWPPRHADEPGGCANDGSGCICECHDAAVEAG
jgi:hypothetical protein